MEIMTRAQFGEYFNKLEPRFNTSSKDSPLWFPEHDLTIVPQYFIHIDGGGHHHKTTFWDWCNSTLNGTVRCYSSSDTEDWWGFTDSTDIPIFLLKWS
jgi:hypothetical protein